MKLHASEKTGKEGMISKLPVSIAGSKEVRRENANQNLLNVQLFPLHSPNNLRSMIYLHN